MREIVLTGGGTGGHIFPMRAIAEELLARGEPAESVVVVGSRRGQEKDLLGDLPVQLILLPGRGIRRSLRPTALVDNVVATMGLILALLRATWRTAIRRPRVVVSFGGYASLVTTVAAVLTGRRVVTVELDAVPSAAQRVVLRRVRVRCVAFGNEDPRSVVTGVPLRDSVVAVNRTVRVSWGAPDRHEPFTIVVMTGSLGARSVNETIGALAQEFRQQPLRIIHVTGRRDYAACVSRWQPLASDLLRYELLAFADMSELWSQADMAICRAGATTVAELCALSIPSILVPLPGAPGDHQTKNALRLVEVGAALAIADGELSSNSLAQAIEVVMQPATLGAMTRAAGSLGHPAATKKIVDEILRVIQ